eukprot:Skav216931  [mRNA]  locus=C9252413:710:1657:- [translate_table: standard]
MQEYVDKCHAKQQLDIKVAEDKLAKGKLSQEQVDAVRKQIRPFVIMTGTGLPATPAYMKSHLITQLDGSMQLKHGSQATMILFDLFQFRVKVGAFEWVPMRVLKAEVQFDEIVLQPDNTFLKELEGEAAVPNLEMYASQDSSAEEEEATAEKTEAQEHKVHDYIEEFAAMGMVVPAGDQEIDSDSDDADPSGLEKSLEEMMAADYPNFDFAADPDDSYNQEDVKKHLESMLVEPGGDESCHIRVWMDDNGDLIAASDQFEIVADQGKAKIHQPPRTVQYKNSEAYKYLLSMDLCHTPPVKGCGLSYNRHLAQRVR